MRPRDCLALLYHLSHSQFPPMNTYFREWHRVFDVAPSFKPLLELLNGPVTHHGIVAGQLLRNQGLDRRRGGLGVSVRRRSRPLLRERPATLLRVSGFGHRSQSSLEMSNILLLFPVLGVKHGFRSKDGTLLDVVRLPEPKLVRNLVPKNFGLADTCSRSTIVMIAV